MIYAYYLKGKMQLAYQTIFKRYELKYMLTYEQKEEILKAMAPYMKMDKYGHSLICNIYFDTDNYRLIRHSIEKPRYKEKLRIRSYGRANENSTVFVELKKKYKHVVYKRRVSLPEKKAMDWICGVRHCGIDTQIVREIDYFLNYYETLHPALFLSYEREAYYSNDGSDFRVTFDENIQCRQDRLSLEEGPQGIPILEENKLLMEIKCSGGIPMWMAHALSQARLYKTSFSKYGTTYRKFILPDLLEENRNA